VEPALFDELVSLEDEHWWLVGRRRLLVALVEQECARLGGHVHRLVDVGSGTGRVLRDLGPLADEAVGVEAEEVPLRISRERGLDVRDASVEQLPFADATVDLLSAFDVLEHIADDVGAAAEFKRVLRPGAVAVVSVPAYGWLWGGHDAIHGHHRRYTRRTLEAALVAAGLHVTRAGYFNTLLFPAASGLRLAGRLSRRPARSDLRPVPRRLNALLLHILLSERKRVLAGGFPIGLSLFAIAENRP
jgi:SAM-dependent methyltransferase